MSDFDDELTEAIRRAGGARVVAARLLSYLSSLKTGPELEEEHTHVAPLLDELVAAEERGEHVDQDPHFAQLIKHLDACDVCLARYEELTGYDEAEDAGGE